MAAAMIASRPEIEEIRARTLDELVVKGKPPKVGKVEPVKAGTNNQPACHVKVLDTWPCKYGGHVVRFELTTDPKPKVRKRSDKPRLLKPHGGYTTNPDHAMRDPEASLEDGGLAGVPHPFLSAGEPEAVPADWEDAGVPTRAQQQRVLDEAIRDRLSLGGQLDSYVAMARESRMDVRNRVAKIEREIELLARDLEDRAA